MAMTIIYLTTTSNLTSTYTTQLTNNKTKLHIKLKNKLHKTNKPNTNTKKNIYT